MNEAKKMPSNLTQDYIKSQSKQCMGYLQNLETETRHLYEYKKTRFLFNKITVYKFKRKKVAALVFATMLLMIMWKNTPLLFQLSIDDSSNLLSTIVPDCPPCENNDEDVEPHIVLDYESDIAYDDPEILTTVGPPPTRPDPIYMRNLIKSRALFQFVIIPWKVVENIYMPVDGDGCVHMLPDKQYFPKWTLVIFVKSKSSNFDRRKAIRSTWGRLYYLNQVRIDKVFVVGQVDDPAIQERLQEESNRFGDILQFEGPDDYRNMPTKVTAAMQWASVNLPHHDIYASSDDDFIVDLVSILDFLEYEIKLQKYLNKREHRREKKSEEIRTGLPIYCVYYLDRIKGPNRENDSKWYVDKAEYSFDRYPPYCGGGFYLMPVAMATDIYRVSRITKVLAMDDVWVTGILRQKLGRGDDNVVKMEWPRSDQAPDLRRKLWKHLWGDYGKKKDIAKLLPEAWKTWDLRTQRRPHCRLPPEDSEDDVFESESEDAEESNRQVKQT